MSVKFRITLVTALFLALTSVAISILMLGAQRAQLRAESVRKVELALSMLSQMAAPALLEGDVLGLARIADTTAAGQPQRVMVADTRGLVIADSEHKMYDRAIPVVQVVKRTGRASNRRTGDVWEGAAPVLDDLGRNIGFVHVAFSTGSMDQAMAKATRTVVIFGLFLTVLAGLVAYGLGRYLSASLVPLLAGIRTTTGGAFESEIPSTGMIEFDEIGQAFNRMSQLVGRQVQNLETLNQLASSLTAARTLEQFDHALREACQSIVQAKAFMLSGDSQTGAMTLVGNDKPSRRVKPDSASFLATNERRTISIGRDAELAPGSEVAEEVRLESGIVAPLITPNRVTAGVLVVEFDPQERASPNAQEEAAVLAVANVAAPILATLVRSWTQEKALVALRDILLPEALPQPEGVEVFASFEPAETPSGIGGDYYDVLPLGEQVWGFSIGDVSGHGLEAGRYTAMAKYVVRSFALEYRSPAKTISQADKMLSAQMGEQEFVTIFFAVLDVRKRQLTYCCAGHPPGLLYSPASESFRELGAGGGLVGYALRPGFTEETVSLQVGDLIVLCTDGILEARQGDEEYGVERLEAVIRAHAKRSLKNIAQAVMDDVRAFARNLLRDDMTLLLVKQGGQVDAGA